MDFATCVFICTIVLYLQSQIFTLQIPEISHCDEAYKYSCDDSGCNLPDMDKIGCRKLDTPIKNINKNEILFAGYKDCLIRIEFTSPYAEPIKTNLRTTATDITALTYSVRDKTLFIMDKTTTSIIAMNILTKEQRIIKTFNEKYYAGQFHIDSMVYDYINKNLIYCDLFYRTVDVLGVSTYLNKVIVNFGKDLPKSVAIIPEQGIIFVAYQTTGQQGHEYSWRIVRRRIDGTEWIHVLPQYTQGPINLHYNSDLNRLFWTDGTEDRIHSMEINGDDRKHIKTNVKYPQGLTTSVGKLFWINSGTMTLMWKDKTGLGDTYKVAIAAVPTVEDIARNFSLVAFGGKLLSEPNDIEEWYECKDDEFMCNSGTCIPKSWECDYEIDCYDRSDEHAKCKRFMCMRPKEVDKFQCNNGRCIEPHQICDQVDDCGDLSDERGCGKLRCLPTEHQCNGTEKCIPKMAFCNGTKECDYGDDEPLTCNCKPNELMCGNGKCIPRSYKCDRWDDCGDDLASDENNVECRTKPLPLFTKLWDQKCGYGTRCGETDQCVQRIEVCDGKKDCPNGEDEGGVCETACRNNKCPQACHKSSTGPVCTCFKGFEEIKPDYCVDVDECIEGICSQSCVNTLGSYDCTCYPGFEIRDDMTTCKPIGRPADFFFAVDSEIMMLSLINNSHDVVQKELCDAMSGLDMDIAKRRIYYTLKEQGEIHRLTLSGGKNRKAKIDGRHAPGLLAVDWTSNNVYVVEGETNPYISLCSFETMKCRHFKDLLKKHKIRAIAVDPINEYVFVAMGQWNYNPKTLIHRITLDGSLTKPMAMMNDTIITGLALDIHRRHVYFSQQTEGIIRKMDYDGLQDGNRTEIVHQYIYNPHNLQIFNDTVYLLTKHGVVVKCNKDHLICDDFRLMTPSSEFFVISQASRQPPLEDRKRANMCKANEMKSKNCEVCVKASRGPICFCEFSPAVSMEENSCPLKMSFSDYEFCGTTFTLPLCILVLLWFLPLVLIPLAFWTFGICKKYVRKWIFHFLDEGSSLNEEDAYRVESSRERPYREGLPGEGLEREGSSREGSPRQGPSWEGPYRRSSPYRDESDSNSVPTSPDSGDFEIPPTGRYSPSGRLHQANRRPHTVTVPADVHPPPVSEVPTVTVTPASVPTSPEHTTPP